MLPPLHILEKYTVPSGGVANKTFTLGTLVSDWDAKIGKTSRHLCILSYAASGDITTSRNIELRFNGDAGNNYNMLEVTGVASTPAAAILNAQSEVHTVNIPGGSYANAFGGGFILIPHAFNTIGHKDILSLGGSAEHRVMVRIGRWASIAAITSMLLYPSAGDFAENSILYLCVVDERYQIGESILDGSDGTFSFPNIEARDGDLVSIGYLRSDRAATGDDVKHEINEDVTSANYHRQALYGNETPAIGAATGNDNIIGGVPGNNATANVFGGLLAFYPHFEGALNDPNALVLSGYHEDTPDALVDVRSARRNDIEPINRIDFKPNTGANFKDGSMMSFYRCPKNLIARHICMVSEPKVVFDGLEKFSQDFEAIEIRSHARTDRADPTDSIEVAFNDDVTDANYDRQHLQGAGAAANAGRSAATRAWVFIIANTEEANEYGCGSLLLINYANNYGHKHGLSISGRTENLILFCSCRSENTNPITKITLTSSTGSNFLVDDVFEVWGLVPMDDTIRPTKKLKAGQSLTRRLKAWRS